MIPLLQQMALAPSGSQDYLLLQSLLAFPCLAAFFTLLATPVLLLVPRLRAIALRVGIPSAVFIAAMFAGFKFARDIRQTAFHDLSQRSMLLVEAIEAYNAAHGEPPESLDALVPEFLPAVPNTGMGAYPDYQYQVVTRTEEFDGNPWVIEVETPAAFMNWDQFMYFPRHNYPDRGYGGSLERIGDWAYVHE